jgi:hypothetical protein
MTGAQWKQAKCSANVILRPSPVILTTSPVILSEAKNLMPSQGKLRE